MPVYDFGCQGPSCKFQFELIYTVASCPEEVRCPHCGDQSIKLVSAPAVHSDSPTWINQHLREHIQGDGEKPISTRQELDAYCKQRNFAPID